MPKSEAKISSKITPSNIRKGLYLGRIQPCQLSFLQKGKDTVPKETRIHTVLRKSQQCKQAVTRVRVSASAWGKKCDAYLNRGIQTVFQLDGIDSLQGFRIHNNGKKAWHVTKNELCKEPNLKQSLYGISSWGEDGIKK